jgi:hypothetical protein
MAELHSDHESSSTPTAFPDDEQEIPELLSVGKPL